ncbi:hypothetical protein BGZ63DRAFT_418158 [Mariannaea sp. PMI_226]|nr:hypothetical protein BGZ63DRAFT_418158 [Mariannaea sp. PMI_226]
MAKVVSTQVRFLALVLGCSHFPLANIPFGIILSTENTIPRPNVAIGDYILDLKAFAQVGGFSALSVLAIDIKLAHILKENTILRQLIIILCSNIINHLPIEIGNYTDFYARLNHAYNSSSVVISGTPIRRLWGQILQFGEKFPTLKSYEKLDFELKLGMFIYQANPLGSPIPISRAEDHIFGYILINDWSTKQPGINNDAVLLPYLKEENKANILNIDLEIDLITANGQSWPQMIAHYTITGCPLRTGDLFGSKTISRTSIGTKGSLLEQTKVGKESLTLQNGQTRSFLQDGDSITIRDWAH